MAEIENHKAKSVAYLSAILSGSRQVIDKTRTELIGDEDYESIVDKLSISKEEMNLIFMEQSFNQFDR